MLLSTEDDLIPQKKGCKRNLVWPGSSADSKIVFLLLTKVVAHHMRPTAVDVWDFGLEFVFRSRSTFSGGLEERLNNFI